jgi:hypothetical protein
MLVGLKPAVQIAASPSAHAATKHERRIEPPLRSDELSSMTRPSPAPRNCAVRAAVIVLAGYGLQ